MKTFYNLLVNSVIATITNFTIWFAIIFFVYLQTQSVFATSVISGIYLITVALTGIWFGSLVDHNQKKYVMLFSSFASLILYTICFILYITSPADTFKDPTSVNLWILVVLILFGVIMGNIRSIALNTLTTILVSEDRCDKANGLSGTAFGVAMLVTSVLSGLLVGHSGMFLPLLLGMIVTILAIIHLYSIKVDEKKIIHTEENKESKKVDIKGTIKVISAVPGLFALIFFTTFNNFLGGVFMSLMDAYGLTLVSVEVWGILWGFISISFIVGGLIISKFGLGKNPLKALFLTNITIWILCSFMTIQPSIILLTICMFVYLCVVPFVEASESTILQKVVPRERQGRVFGFAQSVEQAASPLTAFAIGPIAQFIFIPFMTTGAGVDLIGDWYGVGPGRGIALVFTITGIVGLIVTIISMKSKYYGMLSKSYVREDV